MTTGDGEPQNENHTEMEQWIEDGAAIVLDDKTQPGGRFQIVAMAMEG